MSDLKTEALERAAVEFITNNFGPSWCDPKRVARLKAALLRARAEEAERRCIHCGNLPREECRFNSRAAELRAAADSLEGK